MAPPIDMQSESQPQAILENVNHWLRQEIRRRPLVHRTVKELLIGFKLARHKARRLNSTDVHGWGSFVATHAIPFGGCSLVELRASLRQHHLNWKEGRHTLYLPPQPGRERVLGAAFSRSFPTHAGVKLLKNFSSPIEAVYHHEVDAWGESALAGPLANQLFAAASLYAYGLGPRPYDIVHLAGKHVDMTALVGEHVEGQVPTNADHRQFITRLLELEQRGLFQFANPSRIDCGDFAAPDCNDNLLVAAGEARYVDTQVFLFEPEKVVQDVVGTNEEVLHFGDVMSVVNSGRRFLYQEVPGTSNNARRGTAQRWTTIDALLQRHRSHLEGRLVFDICCNSGMMMHGALERGAHWAFGWDLPEVAAAADRLLPLLGAGRTRLFGTTLDQSTDLQADLPAWARDQASERGAVALFLAAWHHIGFPPGVGELPWQWLIYEGRENEKASVTKANLQTMSERWGARLVEATTIHDGISQARPLALLRRID